LWGFLVAFLLYIGIVFTLVCGVIFGCSLQGTLGKQVSSELLGGVLEHK